MSIAVTGAEGQLGIEFCRQLGTDAIALNRANFDLTQPDQLRQTLEKLQPKAIINCAAYTMVDLAESDPETCQKINADAVGILSEICNELDAPLVQISTDYVFGDDNQTGPHTEAHPIHPLGVYAQTKAAGEQQAAQFAKHIIVRTCGLYGHAPHKPNFVKTMLRLGQERSQLSIVSDQHCTPSYVVDVAAATLHLLKSSAWGLYHVVNQGETTWLDFAAEIFRQANLSVELAPITTAEYGAAAPRPKDSRLDSSKYTALAGPELPHWKEAITAYLNHET